MEKTPFLNPSDFLEDETFLISFNIALICQRICDVQTKILKKYDLTPRQSLVLAYLRNHPEDKITQKILEDKMHLSNPTVTVIVPVHDWERPYCQGKGHRRQKKIHSAHDRKRKSGTQQWPRRIQSSG